LLQLFARSLRTDLGVGIERITRRDRSDSFENPFHEALVYGSMDQRPTRAGADFALIEGKHHKTLGSLFEELVGLRHDVGKEDVWRFSAELECNRSEILARVPQDLLA